MIETKPDFTLDHHRADFARGAGRSHEDVGDHILRLDDIGIAIAILSPLP
jgi:hypothetical protein